MKQGKDLIDRLRTNPREDCDQSWSTTLLILEAADELHRLRNAKTDDAILRAAVAEGWRWAVKAAADSYNDQSPDEMPPDAIELALQNVRQDGAA